MRWKKSGEIPTDGGHKLYFSGKEDKHEQGVGFVVHKGIVKNVIGCRPISSRLMTVRLRASPFNITIIQVYATTSSYDDSEADKFYRELQSIVDQIPKQDFLVVQGDSKAKVVESAQEDWRSLWAFLQSGGQWHRDPAPRLRKPITTLCWQTTISHPEDGHGTVQMEHITTRLTTSW